MVKKGFLKKTGCILISASIILTGWTFFAPITSEAGGTYSDGTYTVTDGTINLGDLEDYVDEVETITSSSDTSIASSAAGGLSNLSTLKVSGNLNLASKSLAGDSSLSSLSCTTMSGADATTFSGCTSIVFSISGQSVGSGYYVYDQALYNGTTLVYVPLSVGSSYTVRSGTTAIAPYAFDDTQVKELNFEGNPATITSVGTHSKWPTAGTVINAYGATASDYVVTYFSTECLNAGEVIVNCDESGTTYDVTVYRDLYDSESSSEYTTEKDEVKSKAYPENWTIEASTVTDYTIMSGTPSTYTVVAEDGQVVHFKYVKNSSPTPTPTGITVTITEVVGETSYTLTYSDQSEGNVITPTARDGYTCSDSYTVTSAETQSHTFTYTKSGGGGGGGGGGSSGGGSSSSGSSSSSTGSTYVSDAAQTNNIYHIIEGAGQVVAQNEGPVKITCDGPLEKLAYILMDGQKVATSNYIVASGSTILTLSKDYIASLPVGDHAVQFQYTDGYALTGLRITSAGTSRTTTTVTYRVSSDGSISSGEHTMDSTPKTADGFDNRYILCIAIFLLGAGAIMMGRQRKLEEILASQRED
ncbi:hypothetical protein [Pseudobutyrivibrio sp.]|uniref:hypothetical protein n=1 Tax=Pseudobutyrivibrio sp. TaxID=2014367 RepID=UPI001D39E25D|nr:hypothetical protein [Pseudobutyrivibrio sp.]MBE5910857.1 hypothetical protein [Pseudobutyrivibrio sp.]